MTIRFAGDGSIPYEVRVEGMGSPRDQVYAPAGTWRGGAREVYPTAADELASQYLAGVWGDEKGQNTAFSVEGAPPTGFGSGRPPIRSTWRTSLRPST